MTSAKDEKRFIQDVKQLLDASTDELGHVTRARLRAARTRALEVAAGGHTVSTYRWLLPAGGLAAVAVAAVAVVMLYRGPAEVVPIFPNGDIDLLTAAEPLELLENLDFYEWLEAETPDAG